VRLENPYFVAVQLASSRKQGKKSVQKATAVGREQKEEMLEERSSVFGTCA
jgi:hypothetical protein